MQEHVLAPFLVMNQVLSAAVRAEDDGPISRSHRAHVDAARSTGCRVSFGGPRVSGDLQARSEESFPRLFLAEDRARFMRWPSVCVPEPGWPGGHWAGTHFPWGLENP